MKSIRSIAGLLMLAFVFAGSNVQAQDLEEILEGYFEANHQKEMMETQSIHTKGKVVQMGMELPYESYQKFPNKFRSEATFQGMSFIQGFNGEKGWTINPMMGSAEPTEVEGEQLKEIRNQANMEGDLWNYEEKGHKLEYVGEEEVEGTDTYKLKLTKEDGDVNFIYLDVDSYLTIKMDYKRMVDEKEIEGSVWMSNYKEFGDLVMPTNMEVRIGEGQTMMTIVIEEVLLDSDVSDELFEMPKK